jgi:hypothetical protein
VNFDDARRVAHGTRFEHALQVRQPTLLLAQPRERRARQCVVTAPAIEAAETLQSACLAAAVLARAAAVRARPSCRGLLDQGDTLGRMRDARDPFP